MTAEALVKLSSAQISIGIFSYNQANFLIDSLNSVNSQEDIPFKVFIFDDFSTDNSREIIESFKFTNPNIISMSRVFAKNNNGLANQLNRFLNSAQSDWLLVLAADDMLKPNAISKYSEYLHTGADIIWGNLELIDQTGYSMKKARPSDTWQNFISRRFLEPKKAKKSLVYWNNFVPGGMSLIRREFVLQAGGWYSSISTEDYSLWLKIRNQAKFLFINEIIGSYRQVPQSMSKKYRDNIFDQAKMLNLLKQDKLMNNFEAAIILNLRIIHSILNKYIPSINTLRQMLNFSEIPKLLLFITIPISLVTPLFGIFYSSPKYFKYFISK